MIKVFGATDRNFSTNGDAVLRPLKAKIRKEDNGEFYLNLECGLEYADLMLNGNIVTANLPTGDQVFRISNPVTTKNKITTKAQHVFFDTKNRVVVDASVEDQPCNVALELTNYVAFPASPFSVGSDITDHATVEIKQISMYDAINAILAKYGGHLVRDNFNIEIRKSIGVDNGVTVRYKKNLKDITCEEYWKNVCTIVYPIGKDGLTLPEEFVASVIQYEVPYCKVVNFQQDLNADDYETEEAYQAALVADLRSQAENYVDDHCVPEVNYKIKADLERITDIGDVVSVIDERLGVDILTNVIAFEYDCNLKKFTEVEFGNFMPTLSNLLNTVSVDAKSAVQEDITNAVDGVNERIDHIVPTGGNVGQVLTKTATGSAWESLPLYDGSFTNE